MEAKEKDKNETNDEEYPIHHFIKRLMLAGIGALSYSSEEFEKFIDKMVERGETAHKDHQARFNEMRERRKEFMHDRKGYTHKKVVEALDHFDVPTKSDIDEVNSKISVLEKKIDELKKPAE
jgi:polyhydroxyalkanoate synthesis regulator phasin